MRTLKKYQLSIIGLLFAYSAFGQNLVSNGDFEIYTSLPTSYSQVNRATGWNNVNMNFSGPPYGSPDYYNTAGSVGTFFGPITPFSGNGQMGFATYHQTLSNFREYISTQLASPMVAGQKYQVSFKLTNGNAGGYQIATNNIGADFSTAPLFQAVDQPIPVIPQVEITSVTYNNNIWKSYTFIFTAAAAYDYITIGNFRNDASTSLNGSGTGAYYFIDQVIVTPVNSLGVEYLSFAGFIENQKINLHWSTASETNNNYFLVQRRSKAADFETLDTIKGAGNSNEPRNYSFIDQQPLHEINYYRLQQTDYNGKNSFSKIIAVDNSSGKTSSVNIFPNPAADFIQVTFPASSNDFQIEIINAFGETILKTQKNNKIDISGLANGIYFLKLIPIATGTESNICFQKFIKQ